MASYLRPKSSEKGKTGKSTYRMTQETSIEYGDFFFSSWKTYKNSQSRYLDTWVIFWVGYRRPSQKTELWDKWINNINLILFYSINIII